MRCWAGARIRQPGDHENLALARIAIELGDVERSLAIAAVFDRARYQEDYPQDIELARVFAAAGDRSKAGEIIDRYAEFKCGPTMGRASTAAAYAELGFTEGIAERVRDEFFRPRQRYVPLAKILERAEEVFAKDGGEHERSSLAIAHARLGNIARAVEHAKAMPNLDDRAHTFVNIARVVRGLKGF